MAHLPTPDPGPLDPEPLAARLGIPPEAVALAHDSDFIDLHLDTFIPPRLWGYDVLERHAGGPFGGRFFGHLDVPRMEEAGLSGGMWSITTNPFRTAKSRLRIFQRNLARLQALVERSAGRLAFARTLSEYQAVRARGAHAVLLSVQGGNAFEAAPEGPAVVPDDLLVRVTLVHLTNSGFGATSAPISRLRRHRGLTAAGRRFVEQLDARRVFLDLAHIHPDGFWEAVDVHDQRLPFLVTHTGVDGVKPHWRNLDDAQIRAVADSGGVVGIMFHRGFLARPGGPRDGAMIAEHLEHVVNVGGEDVVAIGTDYDGAITPPVDLRDGASFPRIVAHLMARGWPEARIRKALGGNFLRVFGEMRP